MSFDAAPASTIRLEVSWQRYLLSAFQESYCQALKAFLLQERALGKTVYPKGRDYFRAFDLCPFDQVQVVILGQDPYHGPSQAHGLSFSVPKGIEIPPSLRNIDRELQTDLGISAPDHGDLSAWALQGVLLLNSVLTVEAGHPNSHQGKGWERFTDQAIHALNVHRQGLVFLLWGSYARQKGALIDRQRHLVLEAPHPSPLSAHRGFLGCKHFSKANHYLSQNGKLPMDWRR